MRNGKCKACEPFTKYVDQFTCAADVCAQNWKLEVDGTCKYTGTKCENDDNRVEKCSTLTKCYNPSTFQYDNSECKSANEACARWGVTSTGCIHSNYCGTSGLFNGVNTNFKCPNGKEK